MTRADAWIHFAQGALAGCAYSSPHSDSPNQPLAYTIADEMLAEFDKRFKPYNDYPSMNNLPHDTFTEREKPQGGGQSQANYLDNMKGPWDK